MFSLVKYILIAALGLVVGVIARLIYVLMRENQVAEIDLREIEETSTTTKSPQ
jgi:hypothetical protein